MATPSYNPFNTPDDNLSSLLSSQKESGASVAKPNGAEPIGVVASKSIFNVDEKAGQGGGGGPVDWDSISEKPNSFTPTAHQASHGPDGDDSVAAYYSTKNGEGLSYLVVNVSANDAVENGFNLFAAYAAAKLLTPNGSALGTNNRATVILPPANYDLVEQTLVIDSDFVDVVASAGGTANVTGEVAVTSSLAKVQGIGAVDQNAYAPAAHAATHSVGGTDPLTEYASEQELFNRTSLTYLVDGAGLATGYDTTIPDNWRQYDESIYGVYGGSKATSIGYYAFCYCASLTSVSLPVATSIGGYAFFYCNNLTSISLPSATNIGGFAFSGCGSLTSISLPAATNIGGDAFSYCSSLASISLPAATSIGSYAFGSCASLTSISLPSATNIGGFAFSGCWSLTSISLPAATSIGSSAFGPCVSLTSISIPAATYIGSYAFSYCYSLTSISLPAATSIGSSAFFYCFSLTSGVYLNAPLSGLDAAALTDSSVTTIHLRPAPNTPAGWTLGPNQTIGGKEGITVVADWTSWPNFP